MPSLDAADTTFDALKVVSGERVTVGPILLGAASPVHILTPTSSVRRIVNMTALTAVAAGVQHAENAGARGQGAGPGFGAVAAAPSAL
jgi:malate dehydrogenase (oxaloacetate-decarboxylating)(NADP+)